MIGTDYNHDNDTNHFLFVMQEQILGALSKPVRKRVELSVNTLKLYQNFCVYVNLYIFIGKSFQGPQKHEPW